MMFLRKIYWKARLYLLKKLAGKHWVIMNLETEGPIRADLYGSKGIIINCHIKCKDGVFLTDLLSIN